MLGQDSPVSLSDLVDVKCRFSFPQPQSPVVCHFVVTLLDQNPTFCIPYEMVFVKALQLAFFKSQESVAITACFFEMPLNFTFDFQ